jgi:hypothetical protein
MKAPRNNIRIFEGQGSKSNYNPQIINKSNFNSNLNEKYNN